MKILAKRIRNIPFTLIHYLALLYMPYFLFKVNMIEAHVDVPAVEYHMTNSTDLIITARALFVIAVILYLTRTIAGYFGSMLLMTINSVTFEGLFDFGCDCVSDEYKEIGRQYVQNVERVGGNIVTIIKIVLVLAIIVLVIQHVMDKKKDKGWFSKATYMTSVYKHLKKLDLFS